MALNERPARDGAPPDAAAGGVPPECPDAEQLAEYADGLLDPAARQAIEAHLVTCADCRAVVVETVAFLRAEAGETLETANVQATGDARATGDAPQAGDAPEMGEAREAGAVTIAPEPASATPPTPAASTGPTSAMPATPAASDTSAPEARHPSSSTQATGPTDTGVTPTSAPARVVPFRSRAWVTGVGAALAVAASLVLIVRIAAPAWMPGWLGGGPRLDALVAALETERTRPVEGRLMGGGGFPYAPAPSPTRGGPDRLGRNWSPDVQVAAAEIAKVAEGQTSARARAALGVALIVTGDLDEAVATLEAAAQDSPNDAAVQTNLSAAYLARARWFNRAEDWPKALTAADRAIAIDPNAPEPYFNRALAYEGLDLTERAEAAWADYTARDRSSAWAREAQERKQALTR